MSGGAARESTSAKTTDEWLVTDLRYSCADGGADVDERTFFAHWHCGTDGQQRAHQLKIMGGLAPKQETRRILARKCAD